MVVLRLLRYGEKKKTIQDIRDFMMWNVAGERVDHTWLDFEPVEILYEFDFPRIYTCKDATGNLYLVYSCAEDRNGIRYLVVPCDELTVERLLTGGLNLRDALTKFRAWIFDVDNSWNPVRAWKVGIDLIPLPGVMLYSHLRPRLSGYSSRSYSNVAKITKWCDPAIALKKAATINA